MRWWGVVSSCGSFFLGLIFGLKLLSGFQEVSFGGFLMALGMLGMAYKGHAATPDAGADAFAVQVMYASLALVAVGVGFLKPNISTIVGRLYSDTDPRRGGGSVRLGIWFWLCGDRFIDGSGGVYVESSAFYRPSRTC